MGHLVRSCVHLLFTSVVVDGVWSGNQGHHGERNHKGFSLSRDWDTDWKLWARSQGWRHGDPVPDYDYTKALNRRQLSPIPQDTGTMWVTRQRGSALIPHSGATVRISPHKQPPQMLFKKVIRSSVTDRPKRKRHRKHRLRHDGRGRKQQSLFNHDQPPASRLRPRPCVLCPGDQVVLASKGSFSVLMDIPPIIPCHPWSSVHKVKSEVLAGPQPGTKMAEGNHKMVLRLFRHKQTLEICVIRYNVIVNKCPDLTLGQGVKAECTLENAWGSICNLTCGPGYLLEGNSTTECSEELEWTGGQPQCILSTACLAPVSPQNGALSCRTPQHRPVSLQGQSMLPDGTICHFQCQSGYVVPPEQSHLTRTRCIAGSWDTDQDPICLETYDLVEAEEMYTDIPVDEAVRLDGKDCPPGFCLNRGKCLTILDEPMCSCQPGYSGPQCEDEDSETGPNTVI